MKRKEELTDDNNGHTRTEERSSGMIAHTNYICMSTTGITLYNMYQVEQSAGYALCTPEHMLPAYKYSCGGIPRVYTDTA